jgi:3-phosphoshikimate 1-carboxyvinyltransferase
MNAYLSYNSKLKGNINSIIDISGSKSESNRLLILQQLYPNLQIDNVSNCNDTIVIQNALESKEQVIDINHAGTAMRFLTAYFSTRQGSEITLTGSERMKQRPIKILVDALKQLGADIEYLENEGFPPLLIKGKELVKNEVELDANISSQYISALILIAPSLPNGLTIKLKGIITSKPYLMMSIDLLKELGVNCTFFYKIIKILPASKIKAKKIIIESDWSSASYYYSLVALSNFKTITLKCFQKNSLQADSILPTIYKLLGVETTFNTSNNEITISKVKTNYFENINIDLSDAPDIAQTIAVTCFGLKIPCKLRGLSTLKIKETDRLKALETELEKLGAEVIITNDSFKLYPAKNIIPDVVIDTYEDHRMAMAFAPLVMLTNITIETPKVVNKSYPNFWKDLESTGVLIDYK